MSKLSRRTLVTSAAALPLAIPAAAYIVDDADAELKALGAELDAAERNWAAQFTFDRELMRQIDGETERLTGIKVADAPEDYQHEYWEVRGAVVKRFEDPNETDENSPWDAIHGVLDPLCRRILSIRATTLAGLAIQVRAAALEHQEMWDDPNDEWSTLRGLIESVSGFLGVRLAPRDLRS